MKYIKTKYIDKKEIFINVLAFGGLVVFFLVIRNLNTLMANIMWFLNFLLPFFIAYGLYFILLPIKERIYSLLPKRKFTRYANHFATLLTMMIVLLALVLFFFLIVPQLITSIEVLVTQIPDYYQQILNIAKQYIDSEVILEKLIELLNGLVPYVQTVLEALKNFLTSFISGSLPFLISTIATISFLVVLLSSHKLLRVEMRKLFFFLFNKKIAMNILQTTHDISRVFKRYLVGQLTDALLVGVVTFIAMIIFKLPYAVLIAFIIGLTNMIPFFGPFIGAIPSALLIFIVDPFQALIFVIIILVLQQVDGNIIAPMIVGDSLDIPPIYILFSITVGGSLFGILGMLIGVPVFTVLIMLFRRFIVFIESKRIQIQEEPKDNQ